MREIGHVLVCREGDGGSGGGFFNSISKLFSSGAQTAEPGFSGEAGNILSNAVAPAAEPGFSGVAGNVLSDAVSAAPLTGAISPTLLQGLTTGAQTGGAAISPGAAQTVTTDFGTPGSGTGSLPGPAGGAAATAAPASIDPNAAVRGIAPGTALEPQTPGFTNTVAQNGGLDPKTIGSSVGTGTGSSLDTAIADPSLKNILKAAGANSNILLPAAGLVAQTLMQPKAPEGLDAIRSAADRTNSQSQMLQNYLTTGTLPAGLQAGLDQAKEAAKASIRARYANLPGQSSAMEQELAQADQTAAAQGGQLAIQLFSQGMSEAQVSNQLYEAILQQSLERDKELSSAVGNFTTALAGGGPSLKLSLG